MLKKYIKFVNKSYWLSNLVDIIDCACNIFVFASVVFLAVASIKKGYFVDVRPFWDWMFYIALTGMIFIPSKDQRKSMYKDKPNKKSK